MLDRDRSYYRHRAEVEIERAREAVLPRVIEAHRELAQAYLDRLASNHPAAAEAG